MLHYYPGTTPENTIHYARVPCRPLADSMEAAGLPAATYFSLDVEGAEDLILQERKCRI